MDETKIEIRRKKISFETNGGLCSDFFTCNDLFQKKGNPCLLQRYLDWKCGVTCKDLNRVVQDDNFSSERINFFSRIFLGVREDVTTTNILDGDVLSSGM